MYYLDIQSFNINVKEVNIPVFKENGNVYQCTSSYVLDLDGNRLRKYPPIIKREKEYVNLCIEKHINEVCKYNRILCITIEDSVDENNNPCFIYIIKGCHVPCKPIETMEDKINKDLVDRFTKYNENVSTYYPNHDKYFKFISTNYKEIYSIISKNLLENK
jgi:hypothetical protein